MTAARPAPTPYVPTLKHMLRATAEPAIFWLLLAMFVFAVLAPFAWMVISSISSPAELAATPPNWFPAEPTFFRYHALFFGPGADQAMPGTAAKFLSAIMNSLIVSIGTTIVCMVAGTCAGYAFARLPIPHRRGILVGTLFSQMLPVIVIIIPMYIAMRAIDPFVHLMDTRIGLILLYSGFLLPTVVWIMDSYFQTIPADLEEAAAIDGCSPFAAMIHVILPLSGPGLVAVGAFTFLSSWNEFLIALIFTASRSKTVTVAVTEFSAQFGVDYGLLSTGGVIGSIPPLVLAFLLQRYIVAGLTSGAVKG